MASTQENGNLAVPGEESRSQNDHQTPGSLFSSTAYWSFARNTALISIRNKPRMIRLPVSVEGRILKRMQFNEEESEPLLVPSTNAHLPLSLYRSTITVKLPGGPRKVITRSSDDDRSLSTASVTNSPVKVLNTAIYNVNNEDAPREQFYTLAFQKILQQGIDIAKAAVIAITMFGGSPDPGSHVSKLLRDAKSLTTFHFFDTRMIAILGDSGEGKSSLINSLLHYPGVAKTSDLGSNCTTVITEYWQQKTGQTTPILIEAEYLTQDRIEEHVRDLLWKYRLGFDPEISYATADVQRESEIAWSVLEAAFGHQKDFNDEFLLDQSEGAQEIVASKLIQWTREISWPEGENHDGIWTSTAETAEECCEKTSKFMEDRLWLFTKVIRVYLDATVLKNGIVLVDLPGPRDTSLVRLQARQDYIMKSDYVFVLSRISRARTDTFLKDTINAVSPRQQLPLEDNSTTRRFNLAIVCTITEEIDEESARREFCGPGRRIKETVMKHLDQEIESAKKAENYLKIRNLKQNRKQLLIDARNDHVTETLKRKYTSKTIGRELNVFCISNKTYKKFSDQGNAAMVRTSGIPELRRFCLSLAAERRLLEAKDFLQSKLRSLLNSIDLWTKSAPTPKSDDHTASVSQLFKDVEADAADVIFSTKQEIRDSFNVLIGEFLYDKKLRTDWINAAVIKTQDWAKWHQSVYSTWCMFNGSPPTRAVNWNSDLIWKMRTDLGYQWELFEEEIPTIFEKLKQRVKNNLDKLEIYLGGVDPKSVEGTRVRLQDFEHMYSLIQQEFENGVRSVHSRASEPNSQSYVVQEMIPAYYAASKISGPEKTTQQHAIIKDKIKDGTLFDGISRHLISDLEEKIESFCNKMKDSLCETVDSIRENFDMIMSDAEENQKAEEQLKEQLADEMQKLLAMYQEIQFSILKF